MSLEISASVQNDRKALVLIDTTSVVDSLGNPEGWGVDFNFVDYYIAGTETASLDIIIYNCDGTSDTVTVDLTADGFFEGVTNQGELIYNLVKIDGVFELISPDAFDDDTAEVLPDGIYNITYSLTTISSPEPTFTDNFLFKDNAELILVDKAINLDSKIFSSNTTDLVQLVDISVLEAMMFIVENGDLDSDRVAILNMLNIINSEEYEYYME